MRTLIHSFYLIPACFVLLMATGCQSAPPNTDPDGVGKGAGGNSLSAPSDSRQSAGNGPSLRSPASAFSPYLRVQPQETGVLNATDNGRNTLIAFDRPSPPTLEVFDQDGRPLTIAKAGVVVAVSGIHKGLLLRVGSGNSYLAPNPRATPLERPAIDDDREIQAALSLLEGEASQSGAFQRAIRRADAARPPDGSGQASIRSNATTSGALQSSSPFAGGDSTYQQTPAGSMIRIYFASGGRTIVRPDDGLMRLEAEARDSESIRVTGFTDSTGGQAVNAALSLSRAEAIRTLMLARGIPAERIVVAGVPGAQFLSDNESDRGRAMNRRVEVLVTRR